MTSIVKLEALSGVLDDGPLCYLLQVDDVYFLLDCGWDERFDMAYIEAVKRRIPKINAVLLSYGDIAHAGALPYLVAKCGLKCPVYATVPVCKMSAMFLYDWVQGHLSAEDFSHFNFDDIDQAMRYVQQVKYTQTILLKGDNGLQITPYPAGHMMGGAIWKITKMGDEEIVYAVDFNHKKERHLNGCTFDGIGRPNLLIMDSYNSMYNQARRKFRDEMLLTKLLNTVRNGGDVMLVIDTAGRMLELAHLLDQLWQNVDAGLMTYSLVMLSSVASSVVEYAKSLIEWMSDKIQKNFEVQRTNPFQFRHVQLCHNKNDLYRIRSPKVVLVSGLDMESGLSRELFLDWCANSKNTIIVSGRSGDRTLGTKLIRMAEAREANRPISNIIRLEVKRRVLLDGAELEAWIRKKKEEEQEAIRQRLEAARRSARLEYAVESDDSDDEDTLAAVCEAAATGANNYRKLGPNKNDFNKRNTKSSILWTYEPQQKSSFFKQNKRSFPMFPHHEHRIKMDAYGEMIRPEDYIVNDGIVPDIDAMSQEAPIQEEIADRSEAEPKPMSKPLERPTKCVTSKTKVEVLCRVEYIDFEGRSDGESIKKFLGQIKPKQLILVHGSPEATQHLSDYVKENDLVQGSVFTPCLGEVVDATIESHILQVVLNEQLMSSLVFQKVKDAELAWIDARVLRKIENNQIVFEPLVGEKLKALESEAAKAAEPVEKMEVDEEIDPEENAPVQRRVEENTAVEKLYLEMLPVSEIPPHQAVFVNDPKLSDMKHFFVAEGFQADFNCGMDVEQQNAHSSDESDVENGAPAQEEEGRKDNLFDLDAIPVDSTYIDLVQRRVTHIPDLSRFQELQELCLRQNFIKVVENLTHLTLENLELYDNQLTEIQGLDQLVNLESLDLSHNRIHKIEGLDKLVNLKSLFLVSNKITKIEGLENLVNLELLELGDNRIRKIENINHLTKIKKLFLGKNKIRKIEGIENLTEITTLALPANRLLNMDGIQHLSKLQELCMSDQGITTLEALEPLKELIIVDMANNDITNFNGLGEKPELEDLWVNGNKISDWKEVDRLREIKSLTTVYLEFNPIYKQDPNSYRRKAILALPQITQLDAAVCRT
ncbi:hypothetical protein QR680_015406 [Steinernema hermaphroditum]|uniref:Cleavage and polyadenylation specificity factor subunit 2 n=1 Tax=Steinernema hermaphroditum TaxID=289476 RepID=A0AA39LKS2_9BILA|nr:hypothetical protein QR680_015406 [Steinernema hermaphroditum]